MDMLNTMLTNSSTPFLLLLKHSSLLLLKVKFMLPPPTSSTGLPLPPPYSTPSWKRTMLSSHIFLVNSAPVSSRRQRKPARLNSLTCHSATNQAHVPPLVVKRSIGQTQGNFYPITHSLNSNVPINYRQQETIQQEKVQDLTCLSSRVSTSSSNRLSHYSAKRLAKHKSTSVSTAIHLITKQSTSLKNKFNLQNIFKLKPQCGNITNLGVHNITDLATSIGEIAKSLLIIRNL